MKSYLDVTKRYLLGQKKRTLLTILGIILSCALITAVGTMTVSLQQKTIEDTKRDRGFYHSALKNLETHQVAVLKNHSKLEKVGTSLDIGLGVLQRDEQNPYINLRFYDNETRDIFYVELMEGRMPQNPNEIALEKQFIENLDQEVKVGDKLRIKIYDAETGDKLITKEKVEAVLGGKLKEFTVSGIALRSRGNSGRISRGFVVRDTAEELIENLGNEIKYTAMVRVKKGFPIQKTLSEIVEYLELEDVQRADNGYLISLLGEDRDINNGLYKIAFILAMLIVVATSAVIYNAFHISVLERIRQFGMLRAIGATPKQIRHIVFREAGILSLISIPLGLGSGVMAVKIVLAILNLSKYSHFKGMGVSISFPILGISALFAILAVYFSAWSPAKMAGKVSPISAITSLGTEQKLRPKKAKKSGLLSRVFGIEGHMALMNIKSNKRRFFITVFSMGIGITVFLVFNTFISHVFGITKADIKSDEPWDFKIIDYSSTGYADKDSGFDERDYKYVENIQGVQKVRKNVESYIDCVLDESKLNKAYLKNMEEKNLPHDNLSFEDDGTIIAYNSIIIGLEHEEFDNLKKYLQKGSLGTNSKDEVNDGVLVVLGSKVQGGTMKVFNFDIGDEVKFTSGHDQEMRHGNMTITGMLDKLPFDYYARTNSAVFVTSEQNFKNITEKQRYDSFEVVMEKEADRQHVVEQLKKVLARAKTPYFIDVKAEEERMRQTKMEISLLLYGFVTVISLIGVLNVVNTINTNLILRRREFGLLRAVGMTHGQMVKMIRMEGLFYWAMAVVLGTAAGRGLSQLLFKEMFSIYRMLNSFKWDAVLFAWVVTLFAIMLSIYHPLRRISSESIVDSIRE